MIAPTLPTAAAPVLRDYQDDAVSCVLERIRQGQRRLYIELPTGTGKSMILAHIARAATGSGRVLAIAHRKELIEGLAGTLDLVMGAPPGIVMAERDQAGAAVIVASMQSLAPVRLARVLGTQPEPVALLLIDEAHHVRKGNSYARLIATLEAAYPDVVTVGCTATPYRKDGARMQDVLRACAFSRTLPQMQAAGWLCPLTWRPVPLDDLDLQSIGRSTTDGEEDYQGEALAVELLRAPLIAATVAQTAPHLGSRRTVVFGADVAHAKALAAAYGAGGLAAAAVWGEMPARDRDRVLSDWRAGRLQIVCNMGVLTEGFDYPEIAAVVIARPTMNPGLYTQMVGRGTRPARGKVDCLVLDVCGNGDVTQTRQILLPDITGLAEEIREPGAAGLPSVGVRNAAALWITDPVGHSPFAWGVDEHSGTYLARLTGTIALVLHPTPDSSGLYLPLIVPRTGAIQGITHFPCPLREAVWHVNAAIEREGWIGLAHKRALWRDDPATPKQLQLLRRLAPDRAKQARRECWTKGEASTQITLQSVLPILAREAATIRRMM